MSWVEQEHRSRKTLSISEDRRNLLDKVKAEAHPVIQNEASHGDKAVEPLRFQPVRSPGLFEAEFARREADIIFHFWPWGLHQADKDGSPRPAFPPGFKHELTNVFVDLFGSNHLTMEDDRDMGSLFVKISGLGTKQFWRELSIKAVTAVHKGLGGD